MQDLIIVHRKSNPQAFHPSLGPRTESSYPNAVWATCLRQILFVERHELPHWQLESSDQVLQDSSAMTFLLEVLCGLQSPVAGENQVFGQFKTFVDQQREQQNPWFSPQQKWLAFLFAEVKKIRSENLKGLGSQSYGSLLRQLTKPYSGVALLGAGQLSRSIFPWLLAKKDLQIVTRTPAKLKDWSEDLSQVEISDYTNTKNLHEALVIAAPVEDAVILQLIKESTTPVKAIFDLRGELHHLPELLKASDSPIMHYALDYFFNQVEKNKDDISQKLQKVREIIAERARAFQHKVEHRPFGWDDLCA